MFSQLVLCFSGKSFVYHGTVFLFRRLIGDQLKSGHEDWSKIALAISETAIAKAIALL